MPLAASRAANALLENHGHRREMAPSAHRRPRSRLASLSSAMKRSAGRLEWPMVRRSQACAAVAGSPHMIAGALPRGELKQSVNLEVVMHPLANCARINSTCTLEGLSMGRAAAIAAVARSLLASPGDVRADVIRSGSTSRARSVSMIVNGQRRCLRGRYPPAYMVRRAGPSARSRWRDAVGRRSTQCADAVLDLLRRNFAIHGPPHVRAWRSGLGSCVRLQPANAAILCAGAHGRRG